MQELKPTRSSRIYSIWRKTSSSKWSTGNCL